MTALVALTAAGRHAPTTGVGLPMEETHDKEGDRAGGHQGAEGAEGASETQLLLHDALRGKNEASVKLRRCERRCAELSLALESMQADLSKAEHARRSSATLAGEFRVAMQTAKMELKSKPCRFLTKKELAAAAEAKVHDEWEWKLDTLRGRY